MLKPNSNRAILHDANPPPGSGDPSLGECEITSSQLQAILQQFGGQSSGINTGLGLLETERFLIEIEGPWANNNSTSFSTLSASNTLPKRQLNGKKNGSSSMKKLLSSKFQKPKSYVPPPPGTQRSRMEQRLGKRRRPLQPGELVARHYGGGSGDPGGNRGGFGYPQANFNNQHDQDYRGNNYHPQHIRGNVSDNFSRGLPVARPTAQHSGQGESATSIENTNHGMNTSFWAFENRDIVVPGSGTGVSRGAGNAPTGSRVGRLQQHSQYGRAGSQRKSNTLSFVQNEFDSARYYGTDEEDEGGDEDRSPPKASTFAQGLDEARKGEQHQQQQHEQQNDRNSQTQNYDERTNRKSSGGFVGDSLQKVGNTLEHQEMQARNDANQTHSHQNRCQSSTPSSAPLSTRNKKENICETPNENKNDNQSVSKVLVAQQKSGQLQSHHHGKTELDYHDEESEEDDEEFSDGDIAAPVPFQLKVLSAPSDMNKSKDGTTSSSVSGNRLLALFGAGVKDTNKTSKKRESEKENSMMAVNSNGESESKSVDGSQQNVRSYSGAKKDEITNSDEGNANPGHLGSVGGFYLPPADTSSEESSDDDSDEE